MLSLKFSRFVADLRLITSSNAHDGVHGTCTRYYTPPRWSAGTTQEEHTSMTTQSVKQIEADVEAVIGSQQRRTQCLTPCDDALCIIEDTDTALLREFGDALVLREVERMIEADCKRLVAAGKARRHRDGRYFRRYDTASISFICFSRLTIRLRRGHCAKSFAKSSGRLLAGASKSIPPPRSG